MRCTDQSYASTCGVLCFFGADVRICLVLSLGEGYDGDFRWESLGEERYGWVNLGFFILFQKGVDRVLV